MRLVKDLTLLICSCKLIKGTSVSLRSSSFHVCHLSLSTVSSDLDLLLDLFPLTLPLPTAAADDADDAQGFCCSSLAPRAANNTTCIELVLARWVNKSSYCDVFVLVDPMYYTANISQSDGGR